MIKFPKHKGIRKSKKNFRKKPPLQFIISANYERNALCDLTMRDVRALMKTLEGLRGV